MTELQVKELGLLKEFIRVCEKHGLRYYLFGGTLLGAVRHQGFIPWDDDLDICMPRPDFEKLLTLRNEFNEPYFLQDYRSDPSYTYLFAKLRDSSTTFIETVFNMHNINHGIYLDIFPLDGVRYKAKGFPVRSLKPYLMWFLWWFTYLGHFWQRPTKKNWWYCWLFYLISIAFLPFNLFNWLTRLIKKWAKCKDYHQCEIVGVYHTMYYNRDTFPKVWFGEGVKGTFEGLEVVLPAKYHEYLSRIYGDYMKFPPKDKQIGKHHNLGFSAKISYRDYRK
ncbi:MAG: LicD family protein [Bacilli bacterium]|jgi:lipopolysaccharide cholinephosphotransferase